MQASARIPKVRVGAQLRTQLSNGGERLFTCSLLAPQREKDRMINVKNTVTNLVGITVGQRKDGSRAVLFDDNSVAWFDADLFATYFVEV